MQKIIFLLFTFLFFRTIAAQQLEEFDITDEWKAKIEKLAPSEPSVKDVSKKKILVFAKATGFYHWTIPHNNELLKILAKKSGIFEVHIAYDISSFEEGNLKKYDAIILNNPNPSSPERDLFSDLLRQHTSLSDEQIAKEAPGYEANLMNYVAEGGGMMILHGGIVVQNNAMAFSRMTGASFDYHPKQQKMHVKEVDSNHPLVQAFKGDGFTHVDEPYFFKNAYHEYNFRPLLYIEVDRLEGVKHEVKSNINYVSWIKKHGKGRVFYSSPSHNAQSMDNPELLHYFLDGMQYVVGDLKCDDSPMAKPD